MTPPDRPRVEALVELGARSYRVRIGPGLLDDLKPSIPEGVSKAVVVSDDTVAAIYAQPALQSLREAGCDPALITFPAGEKYKHLQTVEKLFDQLFTLTPAVDRDTLIVALGGGVTGDMAGFLAATALRGMNFLQCPTTLLAAVDSSVGGKTGVDHAAGKNLIGAFHQPLGVAADVATFKTLPAKEIRNGLAECVKHGIIRDADMLDFIEEHTDDLLACQPKIMTEFVLRNVKIKAAVVAADEKESAGQRAHLNYGHTIGHAIEATVGFDAITHGQGVSLGMVAEGHIAAARGLISQSDHQRVVALLQRLGLPVTWPNLNATAIAQATRHDKKARAGKVRFVLATALGTVDLFDDVTDKEILQAVAAIKG